MFDSAAFVLAFSAVSLTANALSDVAARRGATAVRVAQTLHTNAAALGTHGRGAGAIAGISARGANFEARIITAFVGVNKCIAVDIFVARYRAAPGDGVADVARAVAVRQTFHAAAARRTQWKGRRTGAVKSSASAPARGSSAASSARDTRVGAKSKLTGARVRKGQSGPHPMFHGASDSLWAMSRAYP